MNYEQIAQEIERQLSELVKTGKDLGNIREAAREFERTLDPPNVEIPFPQIVHYHGGAALRVSIMNGQPHPLATAWVRVPTQWLDK